MTKDEFQRWWSSHQTALTKVTESSLHYLHCHDVEIASSILLDKLEEYLQRICGRLEDGGKLWFMVISSIHRRAKNHIRNSIRKQGLHHNLSLDAILEQPEDYSALLTRAELSYTMDTDIIQQQHVRLTLAAMTLKDRDLLLCTIVEGWTIEDVSKKMGYAQRTGAQAAIGRAKARFRRIWDQKGYGEGTPQIATGGSPSSVSELPRKT